MDALNVEGREINKLSRICAPSWTYLQDLLLHSEQYFGISTN